MVKNPDILQKTEDEIIRNTHHTLEEKFRMFEEMRQLAIKLNVFPPKNPLEGLDEKIEFIRRLHDTRRINKENS